MDAISMLKDDHRNVERLFKRYESTGDRAYVQKRDIVDRIIEELAAHSAIEEQVFYPVARATVPKTEDIALESLEEHHIVKWVLSELDTMSPEDERFDAKVTVLIENVRHHVKEEEDDFFPKVRDELGRSALGELGDVMEAAKQVAPTHAHPRSPDTPPGNFVAGTAAGVADRIGDTVNGFAQGGVAALSDVIATVLGRKRPRVSPSGTRGARSTARRVRSGVEDITENAIEAAREAKRTTKRTTKRANTTARTTTRAARSGAKRTAKTAQSATKRTARTAQSATKRTAKTAQSGAKRTTRTAKRGATSTAATGRRAVKRTASTAKRSARAR
jgi:hemerythrin superfamily protein